jgi:hypothetical protein
MPKRIELRIGESIEVCGYVSPVCYRDQLVILSVGDHEEDTHAGVRTAARRWRKQFDKARKSANDKGNSGPAN